MKWFNVELQGYVVILAENQDEAADKASNLISSKADLSAFLSVAHAAERRPEMGYQPMQRNPAIPPGDE